MLSKTLTAGSQVYELLLTRIGLHLAEKVRTGKLNDVLLLKHGLTDLLSDLDALGERIKFLADHNLSIFGSMYADISKEIFSTEPFSDEDPDTDREDQGNESSAPSSPSPS